MYVRMYVCMYVCMSVLLYVYVPVSCVSVSMYYVLLCMKYVDYYSIARYLNVKQRIKQMNLSLSFYIYIEIEIEMEDT